jgi:hypothetical protein
VATAGHDDPLTDEAADHLQRRALAGAIFDLVASSPPSVPLCIAVFGKWGEGKTTLLNFVAQRAAQSADFHVGKFNPWAARSADDLWLSFAESILQPLDPKLAGKLRYKAVARRFERLVEASSGAHWSVAGTHALVGSLLGSFARVSEDALRQALDRLGTRRLLILIDDLDRARQELVPDLLLALRELFALPRVTFLLAFDPTVVGDALVSQHRGWAEGQAFLEKVLDFQFWLLPPERQNVVALVTDECNELPFRVDMAAIADLVDVLPPNPREAKRLVRGLARLAPVVRRHGNEPIPWTEVFHLELLRRAAPMEAADLLASVPLVERLAAARSPIRRLGSEEEIMARVPRV